MSGGSEEEAATADGEERIQDHAGTELETEPEPAVEPEAQTETEPEAEPEPEPETEPEPEPDTEPESEPEAAPEPGEAETEWVRRLSADEGLHFSEATVTRPVDFENTNPPPHPAACVAFDGGTEGCALAVVVDELPGFDATWLSFGIGRAKAKEGTLFGSAADGTCGVMQHAATESRRRAGSAGFGRRVDRQDGQLGLAIRAGSRLALHLSQRSEDGTRTAHFFVDGQECAVFVDIQDGGGDWVAGVTLPRGAAVSLQKVIQVDDDGFAEMMDGLAMAALSEDAEQAEADAKPDAPAPKPAPEAIQAAAWAPELSHQGLVFDEERGASRPAYSGLYPAACVPVPRGRKKKAARGFVLAILVEALPKPQRSEELQASLRKLWAKRKGLEEQKQPCKEVNTEIGELLATIHEHFSFGIGRAKNKEGEKYGMRMSISNTFGSYSAEGTCGVRQDNNDLSRFAATKGFGIRVGSVDGALEPVIQEGSRLALFLSGRGGDGTRTARFFVDGEECAEFVDIKDDGGASDWIAGKMP